MNLPHNIFVFEVELTLYIFLAYGEFSKVGFTDFIDSASKKYIPIKVALFYHEDTLDSVALSDAISTLETRLRCQPQCFKFDRTGQFSSADSLIESFLTRGMLEIIRLREPILYPPLGKSFVKPSGTRESFFIQTSNLFVRYAEMSFIALLLIRQWGSQFDSAVKVIYVDTSDLYGLTSLASKMRFGSTSIGPITVSYSSYDRFEEILKHADVSNSLMVISATTSHNLLRDITNKTSWKEIGRVATILGLASEYSSSTTNNTFNSKVIAYVKPDTAAVHTNHLSAVRLAGEKFTIEVDEPKSVVLKLPNHRLDLEDLKFSELMSMAKVFTSYAMAEGRERLPLKADSNALIKDSAFKKWLKEKIEAYAPVSTTHVVLMDLDQTQVAQLLEIFGTSQLKYTTPQELPNIEINGSAIVLCPTFTTGSNLLEVSRDLRKHRNLKNVIYFTGIGTPESVAQFGKLRKNLEADGFKILNFSTLATGTPKTLTLSWDVESYLIRSDENLNQIPDLQERAETLERGDLDDSNLFYRVEDLELHAGFKYWEGLDYDPSKKPALFMFSTFAFLFQNARANNRLRDEDRLVQLPNRRVLLDPENFFRYNDSLIQVSILRAAFPVEIDYSDHESHSKSIVYLFQRAEHLRNRSLAYEILLALATKRLRITPEKLNEVKEITKSSVMEECRWFGKLPFFGILTS
jgi:hypothetical protein